MTHPRIFPTTSSPKPGCPLYPCFLPCQCISMALLPNDLNKNENQLRYNVYIHVFKKQHF